MNIHGLKNKKKRASKSLKYKSEKLFYQKRGSRKYMLLSKHVRQLEYKIIRLNTAIKNIRKEKTKK